MNTALIYKYCNVLKHEYINEVEVIWYEEDGCKTLATYNPLEQEYDMFYCFDEEDYQMIITTL